MTDYYEVLGVSETADFATLRSAYLRRARDPDRGGSHIRMTLLNEAWEILSNAGSRRAYDELRANRQAGAGATAFQETVSQARQRAENYPQDWRAFGLTASPETSRKPSLRPRAFSVCGGLPPTTAFPDAVSSSEARL